MRTKLGLLLILVVAIVAFGIVQLARTRIVKVADFHRLVDLEVSPFGVLVVSQGETGRYIRNLDTDTDILNVPPQHRLLSIDYALNRLYVMYIDRTVAPPIITISFWEDTNSNNDFNDESEVMLLERALAEGASHLGGDVYFDGTYLWVTTGDGSEQSDPEYKGQSSDDLQGSILRIDPYKKAPNPPDCSSADSYTIPAANPLLDKDGCDEVAAIGLRHPWRFDPTPNGLMIANTGFDRSESIFYYDFDQEGTLVNYGWPCYQGGEPFNMDHPSCTEEAMRGRLSPFYRYAWNIEKDLCAIVGVVDFADTLAFADHCDNVIWEVDKFDLTKTVIATLPIPNPIWSLSKGNDGDVYILVRPEIGEENGGAVYKYRDLLGFLSY